MKRRRQRLPWYKFYPADWQGDERLGMCSLMARGLWKECLCVMHKAEPYGHLLVNDVAPSDVQIAALARAPIDQVRSALQELEDAGVFSRTRNGTIYSRRMVRDQKKREDGENTAENGTKPTSRRGRQAVERPRENLPPPGVVEQPPPHPEARSQNPEERITPPSEPRSRVNAVVVLGSILDPFNAKRFADHCAGKGKRLSAEQAQAVVGELRAFRDGGGNPAEAVTLAIGRGWTTIRLDWLAEKPPPTATGKTAQEARIAEELAALERMTGVRNGSARADFSGGGPVVDAVPAGGGRRLG